MSEILDEDYEIIDSDAWELKRDMIDKFQELSGRTLTEASPETLIFSTVAYQLALLEEKYNELVPVLLHGQTEICHYFLDEEKLRECLRSGE